MLVADVIAFLQIALVGDINAGLALDGFEQETGNGVAVFLQHALKGIGVVVGDADETGSHGTVVGVALGVVAHSDDGDGAAVEVAFAADDLHVLILDTFLHHAPAASQLEAGLVGFGTSVHGQHLIVAKIFGDILFPLAEAIIVEGAAAEGELLSLVGQGLDNLGVAVTLVDGRVGRKEVEIAFALAIPHKGTFAFGQNDGQRMIVVSTITGFHFHELFRFCHIAVYF